MYALFISVHSVSRKFRNVRYVNQTEIKCKHAQIKPTNTETNKETESSATWQSIVQKFFNCSKICSVSLAGPETQMKRK